MVDSVYKNSGGLHQPQRLGVAAHREDRRALAERIGPVEPLPPEDPKAGLAAFTVPGQADAIWADIEADLKQPARPT